MTSLQTDRFKYKYASSYFSYCYVIPFENVEHSSLSLCDESDFEAAKILSFPISSKVTKLELFELSEIILFENTFLAFSELKSCNGQKLPSITIREHQGGQWILEGEHVHANLFPTN